MIIFYFTSTGNSLAVAKKIGGEKGTLISIPQIIDGKTLEYHDDVIGLVFPVYGFYIPKMCREFLARARLGADYIFAVGTYGNKPGACMSNVQRYAAEHEIRIDYAESLLMVDNYLPGYDMADQIALLPGKNTDANLSRIIADIHARKPLVAAAAPVWRFITAAIQAGEKLVMKDTQAQSYIVNDQCGKCGTCVKICPSGNISVAGKVTFDDQCEWCLGCVHLCPRNAIHLRNERSSERWRNPEVSLAEII
jgi:ferredoxin